MENIASGSQNQEQSSENAVMSSFNPSVSDELEEDFEKLKGDAIGDTLYSERFVLSTLMKVANCKNDLSENENFEQDLCTLWDMTIEHDVVKLLLEHNTLEIFANLISVTEDKRLTEILVGIIANMCDYPKTREDISENRDIVMPIIGLISCTDTLTLVQLMRFLKAMFGFDDVDLVWLEHLSDCPGFIQSYSFILLNSMNRQLLTKAIEALVAMCLELCLGEDEKDPNVPFQELFIQECLITGLIEAFQTLLPTSETSDEGATVLTKKTKTIQATFLDINVILLRYEERSREVYRNVLPDLFICIAKILIPYSDPITLSTMAHGEFEALENINEVFELLLYPFYSECFLLLIEVWNAMQAQSLDADKDMDDDFSKDEAWKKIIKEMSMTILELISHIAQKASDDQLEESLKSAKTESLNLLLTSTKKMEAFWRDYGVGIQRIEKYVSTSSGSREAEQHT